MLTSLFQPMPPLMLGLDIGTNWVKALLLERKSDRCHILALALEPIGNNVLVDRRIKDFDALSTAVRRIQGALPIAVKEVAVAISGAAVLTKTIQMPKGRTDLQLESCIALAADSLIPYPLDEVCLDFEVVGGSANDTDTDDILLSVCHNTAVYSRIALLRELELEPRIFDIEGYALGNAVLHFAAGTNASQTCVCIGANQLQLTVIQNGQICCARELPFGCDSLVRDLSIAYQLTPELARYNLENGQLPSDWRRDLYPRFVADLQQHLGSILQLCNDCPKAVSPDSLLLCGGASRIPNLAADLAAVLDVPVLLFNPLAHMTSHLSTPIDQGLGAQFAIAAGLASRSFTPCHM